MARRIDVVPRHAGPQDGEQHDRKESFFLPAGAAEVAERAGERSARRAGRVLAAREQAPQSVEEAEASSCDQIELREHDVGRHWAKGLLRDEHPGEVALQQQVLGPQRIDPVAIVVAVAVGSRSRSSRSTSSSPRVSSCRRIAAAASSTRRPSGRCSGGIARTNSRAEIVSPTRASGAASPSRVSRARHGSRSRAAMCGWSILASRVRLRRQHADVVRASDRRFHEILGGRRGTGSARRASHKRSGPPRRRRSR